MQAKLTNVLLTIVAVLLGANLLSGWTPVANADAKESPQTHEVLRARLIELVNSNGQTVGQIYTGDDGAGNLRLRSAQGEIRVKLGATTEGGGLIVMNRKTEPAAWLSVAAEQGTLRLSGPQGATKVITP